jgi:Protein of unknown function (DUF3300)
VGAVKALIRLLLASFVALAAATAHAQRAFEPGELESLLAPIALYPDPLLSQILDASQYPQDVAAAAAWSRANPQLSGDAALATVQDTPWAPSVMALVAYPEVLQRMADSPQWLHDLGEAYATYGPNIMATVQELRARAQASGYLQSNDQQYVTQQGNEIAVAPAYPYVAYAPYYDPWIVYGGWWWTFRPVCFRPFVPHPVFVTRIVVAPTRIVFVSPAHVHRRFAPPVFAHERVAPPAMRAPRMVQGGPVVRPFRPVPESQRPPFVHSGGSAFIRSGGPAFIRSSGPAFIHSGGPAFVRSAPLAVRSAPPAPAMRSAPAPRASFNSGFAGGGRSAPIARGGGWHGGWGHGGGHGGWR